MPRAVPPSSAQRWNEGKQKGVLDGIPFAIKDNIQVAGWRNTAGLLARSDVVADNHAPVIEHLVAAGAVLLGRLNMDEAAMSARVSSSTPARREIGTQISVEIARAPGCIFMIDQ